MFTLINIIYKSIELLYIANAKKKTLITMKKVLQLLRIIQLFVFLPFEISKGSKKRAYMKIKKTMVSANLL